jgi:steroid delta-isomerase-like uncharacterized protein
MPGSNADAVRAIEEAWDQQRLDDLDQYFAEDFDNSTSMVPGVPPGLRGAKTAHQGVMQSFPDRKVEIVEVLEDGDKVFVRTKVTGSNQGGFLGVPANSNRFEIQACGVYTFRHGKVVEHWGMNDGLMLMMQLGAFPPPSQG